MKKLAWLTLLVLLTTNLYSQVFITRNGYIGFFSKTPLEDIKGENRQVYAVLDVAKKNIAFTCLLKGFLFRKELMQEHFNENYVESDKYPKASFVGAYTGNISLNKEGIYPVQVKGQLTLHGVTHPLEIPATIEVNASNLICSSNFKLIPGDFNIKIPSLVKEKIAKEIDVHVLVKCNPK